MKFTRALMRVALALCLIPGSLHADAWTEAGREMASRIAAAFSPVEPVALTVRSLPSVPPSALGSVERTLRAELQSLGFRLAGGGTEPAGHVSVTLSENTQSYILVGEILKDAKRDVVIVSRPRAVSGDAKEANPALFIRRRLLLEQQRPVLDVALLADRLLVLDPDRLSLYELRDGGLHLQSQAPIRHGQTWPRDIRGRLQLHEGAFRAFLPAMVCNGIIADLASVDCQEREEPWPTELGNVALVADRNFFRKEPLPPFFSAAAFKEEDAIFWILAAVDGRSHIYTERFEPVGTFSEWDGDIASVATDCGSSRQIIAAIRADEASVQAFEMVNRRPIAVSPVMALPGPITALWPSTAASVLVVSRNLRSGLYAAFHLSVACDR